MNCKAGITHIILGLLLLTGCRATVCADGAEAAHSAQTRTPDGRPAAFSATVSIQGGHCRVFVQKHHAGRIKLALPIRPDLIRVHGAKEPVHLQYEPTVKALGLFIGPGMYLLEISEFAEKTSATHTADAAGSGR